jgi:dihydroflavonol-4-reductase
MTTLVTGGTGFLGRHLVRQLVDRGESVRVLARRFDLELADLGVELVEGNLERSEDIRRAVDGVTRIYHLAGRVERDPSRAHVMYDLHVEGTRRLLDVARDAGVEKVVYASTSGTVGVSRDPNFVAEDDSPTVEQVVTSWPYYLSKIYAERVVDRFVQDHGMNIVTMRPTLLLGPGDKNESSTGDVARFLRGKTPASMPGGISFVDARDAAAAFILAMDKAEAGERYLLGACNITLDDFFKRLSHLSGVRAPWLPIPEDAMVMGSKLWGRAMRAVGVTPSLDATSVDMARHFWYVDSSRAIEELGWQPRAANTTLKDTITWLRTHFPELDRTEGHTRAAPPADAVPAEVVDFARSLRER